MKIFWNSQDYIIINTAFDVFVTKKSIIYKKLASVSPDEE
jgi:hypothetical protein